MSNSASSSFAASPPNVQSNLDRLHILALSDAPRYSHRPTDLDIVSRSSCTTSSPPYSSRLAPDEVFLDGSPAVASSSTRSDAHPLQPLSFKYRSASMSLVINTKQSKATTTPAFGYGGVIDANLHVDGILRPGDAIQLIVSDLVRCAVSGVQDPSF